MIGIGRPLQSGPLARMDRFDQIELRPLAGFFPRRRGLVRRPGRVT